MEQHPKHLLILLTNEKEEQERRSNYCQSIGPAYPHTLSFRKGSNCAGERYSSSAALLFITSLTSYDMHSGLCVVLCCCYTRALGLIRPMRPKYKDVNQRSYRSTPIIFIYAHTQWSFCRLREICFFVIPTAGPGRPLNGGSLDTHTKRCYSFESRFVRQIGK